MKLFKIVKRNLKTVDKTLLTVTILLIIIGIAAVSSASWPQAVSKHKGAGFYYTKRQISALVIGIMSVFIILNLKMSIIKKLSFPIFIITLFLVFALWLPGWASEEYGQERWIVKNIGGRTLRLQPSDFLKVSSILFLAKYLEQNKNQIAKKEIFFVILAIIGVSAGPIMTKDFSTAVVIGVSLFAMFLVGGMKPYQFVTMAAVGVALMLFILFKDDAFRLKRIAQFSEAAGGDLDKMHYHTKQSILAISMGGIFGVGYFKSRQKYAYLPLAHNDFIFCIIAEELGLVGVATVVVLFGIFAYRGYKIAYDATNLFDKYVAVGLTTFIVVQAIFNMGVTTGLFPVTGITLPFISYGGTSLLSCVASAGLLLRISSNNAKTR